MGVLAVFYKQPSEVLDYDIDFTEWMTPGDSIATATATSDAGITLGATTIIGYVVKQWVSGGTDGNSYKVTVKVTTNGGRVKEADFRVRVRES
jgi:hypothetical protein